MPCARRYRRDAAGARIDSPAGSADAAAHKHGGEADDADPHPGQGRRSLALVMLWLPAAAHARGGLADPAADPDAAAPLAEGKAPVDGIEIYYAEYGAGQPVILLHGGLANSDYWGNLIPALAPHYRVIVMDSRGHGRSTRDAQPYGYDLMAKDVVGLMDF